MKIALLGYGKMGKAIEAEALTRGHSIGVTIDNDEEWNSRMEQLKKCDVAVEFTTPVTAVANIRRCIAIHIPVVVGTTGWYDSLDELVNECRKQKSALFVASNFSIGMNIMFELNKKLAHIMSSHKEYNVAIEETHHIHKLDAPSGTAISLAKDILEVRDDKECWQMSDKEVDAKAIPITSIREGEIAGIHTVSYDSDIDTLSITHSAKSRKGLAVGALLAAEYLKDRTGYFTMKDLLNF